MMLFIIPAHVMIWLMVAIAIICFFPFVLFVQEESKRLKQERDRHYQNLSR